MATTITHSQSGSKVTVYPYGATITSFVASNGRRVLFLSKDSKLDGTKAIRGGVPLVFPHFGPDPDGTMPQHGFLRNNLWTVNRQFDDAASAGIVLSLKLKDVVHARGGKWAEGGGDLDCTVTMQVTIDASSLTQTLTIVNTSATAFDFQTLFHTYYEVANHEALDKDQCNVTGLEGYTCGDKITGETYVIGSNPIFIDRNVDRVYTPPAEKKVVELDIKTGGGTTARLKAFGTVDGKEVSTSCVVWNPYKENAEAMGDFNNEGYLDMICCEPGLLKDIPSLEGGKECVFTQVITI